MYSTIASGIILVRTVALCEFLAHCSYSSRATHQRLSARAAANTSINSVLANVTKIQSRQSSEVCLCFESNVSMLYEYIQPLY